MNVYYHSYVQPPGMPSLFDRAMEILNASPTEDSAEKAICEERFLSVIQRCGNLIDRICYSFSSTEEDFNDLRQDVMINIWNGIKSYREESAATTWIYRIAFNTCVSTFRKNKKKQNISQSLSESTGLYSPDISGHNDDIEKLHYLISRLNPIDKSLILLWLEERPYDEISQIMGMPRNTVATRLRRAKEKLIEMNQSKKI